MPSEMTLICLINTLYYNLFSVDWQENGEYEETDEESEFDE